ncbi:hypothetical protein [Bradyrhizobium sp. DOA9]|uniref:hypothetical protein n=1 Tax=Bradyrhizobium sp. DOA9 TaxID=1126627 RepID=UPI0004699D22|nr:hypothetical protein [Bradyrhizobium sp. DOA9]GAJ35128.1 hypothetical protein BDOA9_0143270 [Bradyrhizobium sp. DOA9]
MDPIVQATRQQTAAILAAAMITASGRAWSIEQATNLVRDIEHTMFPQPSYGSYQAWAQTRDETIKKIQS